MAKVLVTGGAGFIGSHIVDLFVKDDHEVHILDNLSSGSLQNLPPEVKFIELDIRSKEARKFVGELQPEIMVHTAAQISVRVSMEDPVLDADINVVGLVNMLHAFQGKRLPHVVFTSTGGAIYGEQESFPADESHPIRPASIYGQSKRVDEIYLDFWARELKLTYTALRLANVYGPRQNPHGEAGVVAIFIKRLLAKQAPVINGKGDQTRDFVFVEDVARAAKAAADKRVTGIFNIGTGKETSVNQIYEKLASSLSLDLPPQRGPAKPGEQMRSCIEASLAKRTLGWEPKVSIDEGLKKTAQWFKANPNR